MKNHDWQQGESLQWARLGLPYNSARSEYICKKCGIKFIHYYHTEENIYKAFKESGLPEECLNKSELDENKTYNIEAGEFVEELGNNGEIIPNYPDEDCGCDMQHENAERNCGAR